MSKNFLIFALLTIALGAGLYFIYYSRRPTPGSETAPAQVASSEKSHIHAPEFPEGLEWLNTDKPLSIKALRGKIVLLDFWTYCCINCMHVIPDLKKLEQKYPNELVVIGVHSAKFEGEKDSENIRQAILRYELEHPVINDKDMRVWDEYAVRAWPSLYLIDPEGYIVGKVSGEGVFDPLDRQIAALVEQFGKQGRLNREPLALNLEKSKAPASLLSFPGKILADEKSSRLFISDSNHNRILIASPDGKVEQVIGSGEIGLKDGDFTSAAFHHPQGLALKGDTLYVADTENHAIRQLDLAKRQVTTIAGTGKQADFIQINATSGPTALNSPWDLFLQGDTLYIAMAGPHQIWKLDLKTKQAEPFAGSGQENIVDGPLKEAALAQPSGISGDGSRLYFADSEVSAIRSADLNPKGEVKTIVGLGLFEFGDKDGVGDEVRLQHPLGVLYHQGELYVVDTYNNKIKRIDPKTRRTETLFGDGTSGWQDGATPRFDEPGGLSRLGDKLYIADTNNHAIRVADLKTKQVSTLQFSGLEIMTAQGPKQKFNGETIQGAPQTLRAGEGSLQIKVAIPEGFHVNEAAPSHLSITSASPSLSFAEGKTELSIAKPNFPLELPVRLAKGSGEIDAELVLYYCQSEKQSLCLFKKLRWQQALTVSESADATQVKLDYQIK